MSTKAVTDLAKQIAENINGMIESMAKDRLKELLSSVVGDVPRAKARTSVAAPSAASTGVKKKRNYQRKPCPVTGCKELAAPRHSMVCVAHKDLSQREKDQYKAQAMAPGGAWYQETREKKRKAA